MKRDFLVKGVVKIFPQSGGWVYIPIPQTYKELGISKPKWGLVPATMTIGGTTWRKSLLPLGNGQLFIALNKKVRRAECIQVGDTITVTFSIR